MKRIGLALALALALPAVGHAQETTASTETPAAAPAHTASHRPFYFGGGVGAAFGLSAGGAVFKAEEEVGYQFEPIALGSGGTDLVMRLGGDFAQLVGFGTFLQFDARFTAAFGVWNGGDIGLRIAPSVSLGGGATIVHVCTGFPANNCSDQTAGAFNFQFGTQGELWLLDGLLTIWLRPIGIDLYAANGAAVLWSVVGGVYIHL
jgi:hypothetical protein